MSSDLVVHVAADHVGHLALLRAEVIVRTAIRRRVAVNSTTMTFSTSGFSHTFRENQPIPRPPMTTVPLAAWDAAG